MNWPVRIAATILAAACTCLSSVSASARSSNPNGWGAGSSSDEIAGHVGAARPGTHGTPGHRSKPTRPKVKARPVAPTSSPASADAYDAFKLPPPKVTANPTSAGLVGVESRFWGVVPTLVTRDLEAGGVTTHLEARPVALVFESTGGQSAQVPPGDRPMPDSTDPDGGVGFAFDVAGVYGVKCTTEWDVRWSSSDGSSGTVPNRSSSASISYPVLEQRSILIDAASFGAEP